MSRNRSLRWIASVWVGFLFLSGTSAAQECVTIKAVPSNAHLLLTGPVIRSGASPATFCDLVANENYYLEVGLLGYEKRRLKFSVSENAAGVAMSGDRMAHIGRSLLIPGWGQYSAGHAARAGWALTLNAAVGVDLLLAFLDYQDNKDEFDNLSDRALRAGTQEEFDVLAQEAGLVSMRTNALRDHFLEVAAFAGWSYVASLFETFLLTSPPNVTAVDGSTVTVEVPRQTNGRAALRSAFFPGLGQKYLGSPAMGALYQTGFVISAALALNARKDYREAADDFAVARENLKGASTLGEIQVARADADRAWGDFKDEERKRDAFYIATGAVWLLNLLDAALLRQPAQPSGRVAVETSYRNAAVRAGVRLSF